MSSIQKQDLVIFNDNSLISEKILDSSKCHLSIISHVSGTSPAWLVNSLIENGLVGTGVLVNNDLVHKSPKRSEVIFISFSHPLEFYVKNCKKNGVDLSNQSNFTYIDCFSDLFTKDITTPEKSAAQFDALIERIIKTIKSTKSTKKIVFIESPELLLLSTDLTSNQFLFQLVKLNKLVNQLFVIVPQDSPQLVDLTVTNAQDPVFKISDFLAKLYHRSQLNLNLQPLSTGRANDITGCLTISRGCLPYDIPDLRVAEKEYIYHVSKESSVKLFFR